MKWSESIKLLRNKMLLTQTEFAEKLGVSFASVNRWENGGYEPTMKVKRELMKLMKEYKVVEE
ncbi:MAG: helix-turn-helix transcriptional regulator [Bacilli bacterium]|nr:helix-turn-helix transcriptional regulator [Bacilli bacterium]